MRHSTQRVFPFTVCWNADTAQFDVYVDGTLVGSHKGRPTADTIGWKAVGERPKRPPRKTEKLREA